MAIQKHREDLFQATLISVNKVDNNGQQWKSPFNQGATSIVYFYQRGPTPCG